MKLLGRYCAVLAILLSSGRNINAADPEDYWDKYAADLDELEKQEKSHKRDAPTGFEVVNKILAKYDHNVPPSRAGDPVPTEIKVGLYIMDIEFLERDQMEMTLYFRQSWRDKRLQFQGDIRQIQLPVDGALRLWAPDTFFRNSVEIREHRIPSMNRVVKVNSTGGVWFVQKLSVKTLCVHKNAGLFPMHWKTCSILIESFSHTADVMYLSFLAIPLEFDENLRVGGRSLVNTEYRDCTQIYTTGAYPCIDFLLMFSREYVSYILKVYLPSALLAVMSLLPLLIGAGRQLTAKLLPGLFAEIGLIYLGSHGAYDGMPETSEVTAMHVWMGFSHVFVLLSIIAVIVMDKIFTRPNSTEGDTDKARGNINAIGHVKTKLGQMTWICDLIIAAVLIVIYIIFNIVYWNIYK